MKRLLIALLALWCGVASAQKISQLPVGVAPSGVEIGAFVQAGNTVSLSLNQIATLTTGRITALGVSSLWAGSCSSSSVLFWGGTCGSAVSAINVAVPAGFTASTSVVGSTINITISYLSGQPSNNFLASPYNTSGPLGLRTIASQDLPAINLAAGGAGGVTGTLPPANGGCGTTSLLNCLTSLLPSQVGQAGNALVTNGSAASWSGTPVTAVSGTFTGTISGCASGGTGAINYTRTGYLVALYVTSQVGCTSNAASMFLTGLPALVQPVNTQSVPCMQLINASASLTGMCNVISSSITFYLATVSGSNVGVNSAFTSSALKGLGSGWEIVYSVQ